MTIATRTCAAIRKQLDETLDELANGRTEVIRLEDTVARLVNQRDVESRRVSDLQGSLTAAKVQNSKVFERRDVEAMTRLQLVSLIEQSINEARRKGMVEAEGLLSRHRELSEDTDLEMMKGVVRAYEARIAEVVAERAKRAATTVAPVKLDARPLSEKLRPAGTPYRAPAWWQVNPAPPTSFKMFDEKAAKVAADAKAAEDVKHVANLDDGYQASVRGDTGLTYILKHDGDVYSCTCPSWEHQTGRRLDRRTCKHLGRYRGFVQEAQRIARGPSACWCKEPLIRGQCQVHTRDWKGSEKCECGRQFASCKAAYDTISVAQRKYGHQPRLAK